MIVKNEARALGRCLESVRDWVGEIIIVDTGSSDNTVAIAHAHGATVSYFPWRDDFSAARNAALDLATREWVLVLDGDETFSVENPTDFADALQQTSWNGFSLPINSLKDDGTQSQAMVFRLFRREVPQMRYRGELHEQLEAVAAGQVSTSSVSCIRLDHDGYTAAVFTSQDKGDRNIRLARKVVQSRPNDPFSWFILAMAMAMMHSDLDGMLSAAQTAFEMFDSSPGRGHGEQYLVNLYHAAIGVHQSRGQFTQVVTLADRAIAIFPDSPDLRYQRGSALLETGNFGGAAEDFTAALSPAALKFVLKLDPGANAYGSRTGLAQAMRQQGRSEEAVTLLRTAISEAPPNYSNAHAELGSILMAQGALTLAALELEEACRRNSKDGIAGLDLAWCQYKMEDLDRAESTLRGLEQGPKIDYLLGRVLLENGKAEQAIPLLAASPLADAWLTLGWAHCALGHTESANQAWNAWLDATPDSDTKPTLKLFRALLSDEPIADTFNIAQIGTSQEMEKWLPLLLRYARNADAECVIQRARLLEKGLWSTLRARWAQALVLGGHIDWGVTLWIEAAHDNPKDGQIYYWLGYCAMLRQQPDDARIMFNECLLCDPDHPQAVQALTLALLD
jgi:tetratricopeptide (TPR) repeat protein